MATKEPPLHKPPHVISVGLGFSDSEALRCRAQLCKQLREIHGVVQHLDDDFAASGRGHVCNYIFLYTPTSTITKASHKINRVGRMRASIEVGMVAFVDVAGGDVRG